MYGPQPQETVFLDEIISNLRRGRLERLITFIKRPSPLPALALLSFQTGSPAYSALALSNLVPATAAAALPNQLRVRRPARRRLAAVTCVSVARLGFHPSSSAHRGPGT